MGFQLSPGVNVTEKDLTTIVPAVQTTAGGFVGAFQWGPVDQRVLVDSEANLVSLFGKPDETVYVDFFTASNFLGYGNNLQVVRAIDSTGDPISTLLVTDGEGQRFTTGGTIKAFDAAGTATAVGTVLTGTANDMLVDVNSGSFAPADKLYELSGGAWLHLTTIDSELTDAVTISVTGAQTSIDAYAVGGANETTVLNVKAAGSTAIKDTVHIGAYAEGTITLYDPLGQNFGGAAASTLSLVSGDRLMDSTDDTVIATIAQEGITGAGINADTVTTADGSAGAKNATDTGTGTLIKNDDDYDASTSLGGYKFLGKYPGTLGNSLKVVVITNTGWSDSAYSDYITQFDSAPVDPDVHILIVDEDGLWTGTANEVIEKYSDLSTVVGAKRDDGSSKYWKEVLNLQSSYIWGGASATAVSASGVYSLAGAVNGNVLSNAERQTGWDQFEDAETVDVSLLLGGSAEGTLGKYIIDIADARKDCVAFLSPPSGAVVGVLNPTTAQANVVAYRDGTGAYSANNLNKSSSYAVMDSGWKYQYDAYNDVFRYIPLNADVAGLCVRTDRTQDPWWSPAGYNRGQVRDVVKLALNPRKAHRDNLYKSGVNPVVAFPGEGTVLFGDKTLQAKPSAFDRINVRRLFIVLEKAIATAAKYSLFEFNDSFTRAQFKALVEPFLRDVQSRRGITDFKVVCDDSNNTAEVIDSNRFVADIYIKPARSINFIQLNFIATRTGASFEEIAG